MIRLGVGTTISRLASSVGRFQALDWALDWSSTTGTNQGSGTGQQYRGARMDGNGRIWAAGGSVAYSGAATPVQDISTDALTVTPGPTGQKVNFIGVAHNVGTGAHEVAQRHRANHLATK